MTMSSSRKNESSFVIVNNTNLSYTATDIIPLYNQKLLSDGSEDIDNAQEHIVVSDGDLSLYLPSLSNTYPIGHCKHHGAPIVNPLNVFMNGKYTGGEIQDGLQSAIHCEVDIEASVLYFMKQKLFYNNLNYHIIYFLPCSIWNDYIVYVDNLHEVHAMKLNANLIRDGTQNYFNTNSILLESEEFTESSSSWFSFGRQKFTTQKNIVKAIKNVNNKLFVLREHTLEVWTFNPVLGVPSRLWSYKLKHLLQRQFGDDRIFVLDFVAQETSIALLIATVARNYQSDQVPLIQYHICFLNMSRLLLPSLDSFYTLHEFSRDYNEMILEEVTDVKLFAYKETYFLFFQREEEVCVGVHPFISSMMKRIFVKTATHASILGPDLIVYTGMNGYYTVGTHIARQHFSKSLLGKTGGALSFYDGEIRPIIKNSNQNHIRDLILKQFVAFSRGKQVEKLNFRIEPKDVVDACRYIVEAPFASTFQWMQEQSENVTLEEAPEVTLLIRDHIQRKCEDYNRFLVFIRTLWNELPSNDKEKILEIGEKLFSLKGVRLAQHPNEKEKNSHLYDENVKALHFSLFKTAADRSCGSLSNLVEGNEKPTIEMFYSHSSIVSEFLSNLSKEVGDILKHTNLTAENRMALIFFVGSVFQNAIYQIREFRSIHRSKYDNLYPRRDAPAFPISTWVCQLQFRDSLWNTALHVYNLLKQFSESDRMRKGWTPVLLDILFDLLDFRVECTRDANILDPQKVSPADFIQCRNESFEYLIEMEHTLKPVDQRNDAQTFAEKYLYFEALIDHCFQKKDNEQLIQYIRRFKDDGFLDVYFNYLISNRMIIHLLQTPREYWNELDRALVGYPELRWMLAVQRQDYESSSIYLLNASEQQRSNLSKKVTYSLTKLCKLAGNQSQSHRDIAELSRKIRLIEIREELFSPEFLKNQDSTPRELILYAFEKSLIAPFASLIDIYAIDAYKFELEIERALTVIRCLVELYILDTETDPGEDICSQILYLAFQASYHLQNLILMENTDENETKIIMQNSALALATSMLLKAKLNVNAIAHKTLERMTLDGAQKGARKVFQTTMDFLLREFSQSL